MADFIRKLLLSITVSVAGVLEFSKKVMAQNNGTTQQIIGGLGNSPGVSLSAQRVYEIVLRLSCWLAEISLVIMVIAILIYGLMFMWARGNPQAFSQAKSTFVWGIVGCLVIFGTYTIIATVYVFVADPTGAANVAPNPSIILDPLTGC